MRGRASEVSGWTCGGQIGRGRERSGQEEFQGREKVNESKETKRERERELEMDRYWLGVDCGRGEV